MPRDDTVLVPLCGLITHISVLQRSVLFIIVFCTHTHSYLPFRVQGSSNTSKFQERGQFWRVHRRRFTDFETQTTKTTKIKDEESRNRGTSPASRPERTASTHRKDYPGAAKVRTLFDCHYPSNIHFYALEHASFLVNMLNLNERSPAGTLHQTNHPHHLEKGHLDEWSTLLVSLKNSQ